MKQMSFESDLIKTYDNVEGNEPESMEDIAPIGHHYISCGSTKTIVDVKISEDGTFVNLEMGKGKKNSSIIIPVTEESSSRTGNAVSTPHPLNDDLQFMSKQFLDKKGNPTAYNAYTTLLKEWCSSDVLNGGDRTEGCRQIKAIYKFVTSNDLLEILKEKKSDELPKDDKTGRIKFDNIRKYLVRWSVISDDSFVETRTWKNKEIRSLWTDFYIKKHSGKEKSIDCISGQEADIENIHPKLETFGNSKLISVKDEEASGFGYKGERFVDKFQIAQIGYVNAQKMFNTLDWLLLYQSIPLRSSSKSSDTIYLVCWLPETKENTSGQSIMDLTKNVIFKDMTIRNLAKKDYIDQTDRFRSLINGFSTADMDAGVSIVLMSKSGSGRCSPVMYRSLTAKDFIGNIRKWHEAFNFYRYDFSKRKNVIFSPSLYSISEATFGSIQNDMLKVYDNVQFFYCINVLLNSVIDGTPIPGDILKSMYRQASSPLRFKRDNKVNDWFFKVLPTACAALHFENLLNKKGDNDMTLDRTNDDRSYLFGRLLAVLEKIETDALKRNGSENRLANAVNYFNAYTTRPFTVYKTLTELASPYLSNLKPGIKVYYDKEIGSIIGLLTTNDAKTLDRPLEPSYLLGYYNEKSSLYTKQGDDNKDETEDNKTND